MNKTMNDGAYTKGLALILVSVIFWSILPLALKFSIQKLDGVTITWFRFMVAVFVTFFIQYFSGTLSQFKNLNLRDWGFLIFAALFLVADYIGFVIALNYISASASQVFSQVTPFFLALGGIIFFKEKMSRFQVFCFIFLLLGLVLFFIDTLNAAITNEEMVLEGALIIVGASLLWSLYALLQKKLHQKLSPSNILLFTYAMAIFLLYPLSNMGSFDNLNSSDWSILIFCAFNTLIAYGAFAESLRYWSATQVGTMLATTPLLTIAATSIAALILPQLVKPDQITEIGWFGVVLVIFSVAGFNIAQKRQANPQ